MKCLEDGLWPNQGWYFMHQTGFQSTEAAGRGSALQALVLRHWITSRETAHCSPCQDCFQSKSRFQQLALKHRHSSDRANHHPCRETLTISLWVCLVCSLCCVGVTITCTICTWPRYNGALPALPYAAVSYLLF